jgi:hypothetical protein
MLASIITGKGDSDKQFSYDIDMASVRKPRRHRSKPERLEMLRIFDEMVPRIPVRAAADVEQELKSIRRARRSGGRRS